MFGRKKQISLAFCEICGECLGKYRKNFAKEHGKLFPSHTTFLVKTIIDPLKLPNIELYIQKKLTMLEFQQTRLNTKNEDQNNSN